MMITKRNKKDRLSLGLGTLLLCTSILTGCGISGYNEAAEAEKKKIEALFAASEENLLYANYLSISGQCEWSEQTYSYTDNSKGRNDRVGGGSTLEDTSISYKRTYQDSSNYMGRLEVLSTSTYTPDKITSITLKEVKMDPSIYGYTMYEGVVEGNPAGDFITTGSRTKESADMEKLICPDISQFQVLLDSSDPEDYKVTLTADDEYFTHYLYKFSDAMHGQCDSMEVTYHFDPQTSVLKKITISGNQKKSKQTSKVGNIGIYQVKEISIELSLNVDEYSFEEHSMIKIGE